MTSINRGTSGFLVGFIVLFVVVGLPAPAHAYVDLGSGSYMLQLLMAGLFGIIFAAKSFWAGLRAKYLQRNGR